jgi:hypothetical protein
MARRASWTVPLRATGLAFGPSTVLWAGPKSMPRPVGWASPRPNGCQERDEGRGGRERAATRGAKVVAATGVLAFEVLDAGSIGVSNTEGSGAELVAGSTTGVGASRARVRRGEVPPTSDEASRARARGGESSRRAAALAGVSVVGASEKGREVR